ncbi:MAG: ORC1-type DNA replication protein [Candidatus Hydrothermarchaeaceae archaeon]
MGKFFRGTLSADETLFKDARHFDLDYIPKDFNHRDSQLRDIETCLKPAVSGGRAVNAKIFGPPATGKTTAIKLMFEEVRERTDKVICVHINCQIHTSKFTVFSQIHNAVLGHIPPETGVPFSKVYERIFKKLISGGKSLVVALDDMNYLFYDRHANEIIYDILRVHEVFPGAKTAVFGILSEVDFDYKLDAKVSSIYRPYEIFFQPYRYEEILSILKDRAREGFFRGVISESVIEKIAGYSAAQADLRIGIELLRKSAIIAESAASRQVKGEHVEKAYESSRFANLREVANSLSESERNLVRIIAEKGAIDSGKLYRLFCDKTGKSYTKFYRVLDKLESIRLIDTKFTGKGKRGRTRTILPRYEKSELLNALER